MKIFSFKCLFGLMLAMCLGVMVLPPLSATGIAGTKNLIPKTDTVDPEAKKIHISAKRLISNMAENNAEFIGNVQARQGETTIIADSLKIFFSGKSESEDTPATQSLDKLVATGNVEIKFDNRLAVARQAVYITAQRMLILNGPDASVTSGENTITGETITVFRDDGRFTVEGGTSGRVKAVILPEESGLE